MAEVWIPQSAEHVSLRPTTDRPRNFITMLSDTPTPQTVPVRFAHPAESAIAGLLSRNHIAWIYEPTTFPLVTGSGGEPIRGFTPDFFLPEHDVYIEMTTMRQSLVTRKNRKMRLMKEIYPGINVKLLYRKDVELIVNRYCPDSDRDQSKPGSVFLTSEQIVRRASEIALRLAGAGGPDLLMVSASPGADRFSEALVTNLVDAGSRVRCASLAEIADRRVRPARRCDERVVLVMDVVGTGVCAWNVQELLHRSGFGAPALVTLLDRPSARIIDLDLAHVGFVAPSSWIVGYGLGDTNAVRDLNELHVLPPAQPGPN